MEGRAPQGPAGRDATSAAAASAGAAAPRTQRWVALLLASVSVALAVRLFAFANRYAVDILFSDQWDLWQGLFDGADPWTLWRWQHGPQRQGIGQLIIAATARLSGWNVRAEVFVSTALMCVAAVLALALARSLRGRWSPSDVVIPLVVLTVSHWENLVLTPNPSHGPLPLVLVAAFGLAGQVRGAPLRAVLLGAVTFLAIQTGFTLFLGVVAVPILAVLLAGAVRDRRGIGAHVLALALVAAASALFLHGFRIDPAVACFRFPDPQPSRYLPFAGRMFLRGLELLGDRPGRLALGIALPLACAAMAAWGGWRMVASLGRERLAVVTFAYCGFSLLFVANATVGRACMGPEFAISPRYIPYTAPFFLAVHLVLSSGPRSPARLAALAGLTLLWTTKELRWTRWSKADAASWARDKAAWRACYLASEDARTCTAAHSLGAATVDGSHIEEKLRFMRDHRVGLYRPGVAP